MKRRNFLRTGALSLVSLSLPAPAFSLNRNSNVHNWVSQLAISLSARRRISSFDWPQQLREQVQQTDAFLAGRNFLRETSGAFFCAQGQTCFYPLVLRNACADMAEVLMPVFHRQADGTWKRLAALTGYQIEALTLAASALANQEIPLNELLLPAGKNPAAGSEYFTRQGRVVIKTQIQNGTAETEIQVFSGNTVVFAEQFSSRHTLSSDITATN